MFDKFNRLPVQFVAFRRTLESQSVAFFYTHSDVLRLGPAVRIISHNLSGRVYLDKVNWHLICLNDVKFRYLTGRERERRYLNWCAVVCSSQDCDRVNAEFFGGI